MWGFSEAGGMTGLVAEFIIAFTELLSAGSNRLKFARPTVAIFSKFSADEVAALSRLPRVKLWIPKGGGMTPNRAPISDFWELAEAEVTAKEWRELWKLLWSNIGLLGLSKNFSLLRCCCLRLSSASQLGFLLVTYGLAENIIFTNFIQTPLNPKTPQECYAFLV